MIQEAGLDGFWIDRVLHQESWIQSHIVDAASVAVAPASQSEERPVRREMLFRTLLSCKRGEPRVCSIVRSRAPTSEEDHRRICRERKTLVGELTLHINHIKGCSSARASPATSLHALTDASARKSFESAMAAFCPGISRPRSAANSVGRVAARTDQVGGGRA